MGTSPQPDQQWFKVHKSLPHAPHYTQCDDLDVLARPTFNSKANLLLSKMVHTQEWLVPSDQKGHTPQAVMTASLIY
jgi:hypothetical protein